ncbi:MAG: DUF4388 domain-containing protein, partial [Proteobacteria bacterium]|nr:DUF4388 domain-containing protein [Pseudomonadota bacterium]
QIVALSGKSGILHIKSNNRVGKIYFYKGKVIKAFSDAYRVNLGELLVRKGIVSGETIKKALERQREFNYREKLGTILINDFHIPKEKIEECVTELIEKTVFSLFYWTEGEFRFELTDEIESEAIKLDLLQYDLTQGRGLNPQFLAMEGSRILDECRKEGVTPQECYAEFASQEELPQEQIKTEPLVEIRPKIVYLDEFAPFRVGVKKLFEEEGFECYACESVDSALNFIESLNGMATLVITSLIIPKTDGSGILGGLEILKKLSDRNNLKFLVVSDYSIKDAEDELQKLNIPLIKKPKKSQINRDNVRAELDFYVKTLKKTIEEIYEKSYDKTVSVDETWDSDIKKEFNIVEEDKNLITTPGLTILKSMMLELTQASSGNDVILMILRLASEIMPRGIVFAIKNNRLFGLGQFGLERFIETPQRVVKTLVFDIKDKIKEIMDLQLPYKGKPEREDFFIELYKKIGVDFPTEVFISVVTAGGKPVILFYGDNLPGKKPIEDTDALEIFLTQAGITMERLLLEKKVK